MDINEIEDLPDDIDVETERQGSPPPKGGGDLTPRDLALGGLSPDVRAAVLAAGADLGIVSHQDAAWLLVRHVRAASEAALAAAAAAETIKAATASATAQIRESADAVPEIIRRGALAAGDDLAAGVKEATKPAGNAIKHAIKDGVEAVIPEAAREFARQVAPQLRRAASPGGGRGRWMAIGGGVLLAGLILGGAGGYYISAPTLPAGVTVARSGARAAWRIATPARILRPGERWCPRTSSFCTTLSE